MTKSSPVAIAAIAAAVAATRRRRCRASGHVCSGARLRRPRLGRSRLGLAGREALEQAGELEKALGGALPWDQPEVAEVLLAQAHAPQDRAQAGRVDEGEAA